jgi:hypothetical protein
VRTFRREESAVVEVTDNGIGIGEMDLPFIFDPFYKADAARQLRIGEMGLGLAIVRRVVEAHGGRVEVEVNWAKAACSGWCCRLKAIRLSMKVSPAGRLACAQRRHGGLEGGWVRHSSLRLPRVRSRRRALKQPGYRTKPTKA